MDDLLAIGRPVTYAKGEILIRPSDSGDDFFVLVSGMVHVYSIEESGDKNIHIIYGESDIFPLAALANKHFSNIYYEAITNCDVIRLKTSELRELLQSDAKACFGILEQVIGQFILYKSRVDNLEYKFARERIAYRLLLLGRKFGHNKDGVIIMDRLSQDEIGSATNVSREGVSRELRRFERLGYISYAAGEMKLHDLDALRKELAAADSPLFIDDI